LFFAALSYVSGASKHRELAEANNDATHNQILRSIMADEIRATATPATTDGGSERPERTERRPPRPYGQSGPGGSREGGAGRKFFRRKKVCKFCTEKIESANYKDVRLLAQFVAESGKIVPRRLTGVCTPHQRRLSAAIKQARNIALLPFAGRAS
jgi:small subunit ribosomal protein S18